MTSSEKKPKNMDTSYPPYEKTSIENLQRKITNQKNKLIDKNKKTHPKKNKMKRRFHRNYKNGDRSHFGLQQIDLFGAPPTLEIEAALADNENNIQEFVKTYLKNRSIDPFKHKKILSEFKKEGYGDLAEEYMALYDIHKALKKELTQARAYENHRSQWKHWKDQDQAPSKSMRKKITKLIIKDAIPKSASKLPVIGPFASMGFMAYNNLKSSIHAAKDEAQNLFAGTRQKIAIGRLASIAAGTTLGAAGIGVTLALAGSFVPAIGTATGGIAGIILGSTLGAATGGMVGLSVFNTIASKSKHIKNEILYEMDYKHLKHLRKTYGFNENKILTMYAYLNNQIKIYGSKSEIGKDLKMLRKSALEKGDQNALIKLCMYFIGQEQILRAELYEMSLRAIVYQQEKSELLAKKRDIEARRPSKEDIQAYEEKLNDNLFVKELYRLKQDHHLKNPYLYFIEIFQSYPTTGTVKAKEKYKAKLKKDLGLNANEIDSFIKLMTDSEMQEPENLSYFMMLHSALGEPPLEKWETEHIANKEALQKNEINFQEIQAQKIQMKDIRQGIVALLDEFQNPSEFTKLKQKWIYGSMKKNKSFDDPIKDLFEPSPNENIKNAQETTKATEVKSKDIRTFGLDHYAVLNIDSAEMTKSEFREEMRENALKYATEEAKQYDATYWMDGFESHKRDDYRNLIHDKSYINSLEYFFSNVIDQELPELLKALTQDELQNVVEINNKCKNIIFSLKKIEQDFPELSKTILPKREALQNIQFYLDYASIKDVYARRDLAQHAESPLQELFPYTFHGMVEHLKKDGQWIKTTNVRDEVIQRMKNIDAAKTSEYSSHAELQKTISTSALLRETAPIASVNEAEFPILPSPDIPVRPNLHKPRKKSLSFPNSYCDMISPRKQLTTAFTVTKEKTSKSAHLIKKTVADNVIPFIKQESNEIRNDRRFR